MTNISEKDQKILWGRAAGRCSIAECRTILTHEAAEGSAKTIGEMAHIVAAKQDGPRGMSVLDDLARAAYSNHILLCPNHHAMIDADPTRYAVELLHSVKAAHEMWVAETLTAGVVDPGQLVYANLVDAITVGLQLDTWTSFIENAIHDRMPERAIDAQSLFAHLLLATIWPGTLPNLEASIQRLLESYADYVFHYLSSAEPIKDGWLGPDHSYRRDGYGNYQAQRDAEEAWSRRNYALLCRLTIRLNQFADTVRLLLNPLYFRVYGRFVIVDSLGTWHNGVGTFSLPDEEEVENRLASLGWKSGTTYAD